MGTVLYAVAEGQQIRDFAVEDEIRPESREAITELHRLGIKVAMICRRITDGPIVDRFA